MNTTGIEVIEAPIGAEQEGASLRTGSRVELAAEWHGRTYHGRIVAMEYKPATRLEPSQRIAHVAWDDGGCSPIPLEAARLTPCACGKE